MEPGNENINPKFNLPVHNPDPELWNRIETEMDYLDMVESYDMNVREMPVHSPAERVWQAIEARLPFIPVYRRSYFRVGMAMLAIVAVSFLGWIISQLIIDISPETTPPPGNTTIESTHSPEKTTGIQTYNGDKSSLVPGAEDKKTPYSEGISSDPSVISTTGIVPDDVSESPALSRIAETPASFPLAREKPAPGNDHSTSLRTLPSFQYGAQASPSLLSGEDDYFMPKRKRGHYTLGAYTMPEYMHFTGDVPDNSALSTNYGLSFRYGWSTFFIESGLGYRQFTANSLYGVNFSDLQLLGSVLVVNEFQIVQYYNDEGELIVEKIYKPRFVQVYDTASTIVEEETDQRYSFIDIPIYFGKVLYSKNRYALAAKAGAHLNIPLKNVVNAPVPAPQDADLVTVQPIAVLASKFFIQFNAALENRVHFSDRGYISFEPMIGYHQQTIEYTNEIKRQSSWSAGLRAGIHYQIK